MAYRVVRTSIAKKPASPKLFVPQNIYLMDTGHEDQYDDTSNRKYVEEEAEAQITRQPKQSLKPEPCPITILDPRTPFDTKGENLESYTCTFVALRKWLIFSSGLHVIGSIATITLWVKLYYGWPLTFASKFQPGSFIFRSKWIAMILGLEPLYHLILLIHLVIRQGPKKPSCIQRYYQIATWLLILLSLIVVNSVYFLANLSLHKIEKRLYATMELYYEDEVPEIRNGKVIPHKEDIEAKNGWNKLQKYLHCCGNDGYEDWESIQGWQSGGFPQSCCKNGGGEPCIHKHEDFKKHFWDEGCLMKSYELFQYVGGIVLFFALFCILASMLSIYLAKKYYVLFRRMENPRFKLTKRQFLSDIFCCQFYKNCRKSCRTSTRRNQIKIYPLESQNVDLEQNENEIAPKRKSSHVEVEVLFQRHHSV